MLSRELRRTPGTSRFTEELEKSSEIVKGLYDAFAKADVPTVFAAFDPGKEWREAEGFLYADRNPYVGP